MRILLATDGSVDSEVAARTLVDMGPPAESEIVVFHVIESPHYWMTPGVPVSYQHEWHRVQREMLEEAEESATLAIEQAKRIVAGVGATVRSIVLEGHPAEEIVREAGDMRADLVVVGSKGLTGSQLFLLGSVSQKVIKYAPCSVLLAKRGGQPDGRGIMKVILATDGSENASAAAKFLSSFRLRDDAEVVVLHVEPQDPHGVLSGIAHPPAEDLRRLRREHGESLVEGTRAFLASRFNIITSIREGHPAEQILKATSEMGADLIVVGSKGLSGIKLFLLGSVSQRVCRHSDRSVLLVKSHTPSSTKGDG